MEVERKNVGERSDGWVQAKLRWVAGFLSDILIIAGVVFLLTQYVVSIGTVSGKSMETNLVDSQKVLVDKVSYIVTKPKRFDTVVVKYPGEEDYWIKRVIGLPGDLVEYRNNGRLYVNDVLVEEPFLSEDVATGFFTTKKLFPAEAGIIPEGQYLVIGDNRNNSTDSRVMGTISKSDILGVARLSIFPFDRIGILENIFYRID